MAKVGLKDTLALLAAGYKKKDIDALAELDDVNEVQQQEVPAPVITDSVPAPAPDEDLKAQLEAKQKELEALQAQLNDKMEQLKTNDEKLKKVQQENIHQNSAPMAEEQKKKQNDSLLTLVRGFM